MNTIEATFCIVTPMFIGGADRTPNDGIRPPSVKGALRFWWRALNWGRFYNAHSGNENEAMKALHAEEARLFGLAAKTVNRRQVGGQGIFLLEVIRQPSLASFVTDWPQAHTKRDMVSKSGYLGLGLFEMNEHKQRQAIKENDEFSLKLLFRPSAVEGDIRSILHALTAFGLFGGLGSRARRGFGSVALTALNGKNTTQSFDEYTNAISEILKEITRPPALPSFTAFSDCSRIAHGGFDRDSRQVHSDAGERYLTYRSQPGMRGDAKLWFGFPLEGVSKPTDRRSSPLFFHIHPVGNQFVCLNLFLPAKFLPGEETKPDDFAVVASFLDDLTVLA